MGGRARWGLLTAWVWATLFCACQPTEPRVPLPFLPTVERGEEVGQAGVLYTVYVLQLAHPEHSLVEELWTYVDERAPQGASAELRRQNNLRLGLLKQQFRPAAEGVLERLRSRQVSPIPTLCPVGVVQFFACGRARQDVTLFLWTAPDEVWARSFAQVSLTMEVEATPVRQNLAELVVTPALGLEPMHREPLEMLQTVVRAPVGASLVVGAVDPRGEALGKLFQATVNSPDDREQVLIITVDAVRPETAPGTRPATP